MKTFNPGDWPEFDDMGNRRGSYNAVDPCWKAVCEKCGRDDVVLDSKRLCSICGFIEMKVTIDLSFYVPYYA